MKHLLIFCLSVVATFGINTARASEVSVELLWAGVYSISGDREVPNPNAVTGKHITSSGTPRLEIETNRISARLGTRFGIAYVFRGTPGQVVKHRQVWKYPSTGLTNPDTGKTAFDITIDWSGKIDETLVWGYIFDYEWGRVPGKHTAEIWLGKRKVIEKSFEVFLP